MLSASRRCARVRAVAFLLAICISASSYATVDVVIRGIVRDELFNPLSGATVVLHGASGATVGTVTTGADGTFSFPGIPFGDYTVEASSPNKTGTHQHLQVTGSDVAEVELYCVAMKNTYHIEEHDEVPPPPRVTSSVSTMNRQQLQSLPQGDDRPITDVVATQPGFVLDAFGNVYARGNHANVQYQIDGIPIPDSVGNLFATALPVRLIQNLAIMTGGMPAEFGDRLAAVVNINTRHGTDTPDGLLQLRYGSFQTVEPSGWYARRFGRLSIFVGGSYLQSQRALDPPAVTPILHDDGRGGRAFLRLDWQQSERDRIELFGSYAYSFFQIPFDPTVVPLDPSQPNLVRPVDQYGNASPTFIPHDTNATETENEVFFAVSWVHQFAKLGQLQVSPYYKLSYGALASDPARALGPLADPGSTASDVTRQAQHSGGVVHYSLQLGHHLLKAGLQIDGLAGLTDYALYVRDDANGGGIDPAQSGRGTDRTSAVLSGAYLEDRWDHGRLALQSGVRVDELHVGLASGSNDQAGVSPRLGASFAFRPDLVGHAFVGVLWQPPAPLDAANAARVLGVVPADQQVPYDIKAETDLYSEIGLQWRVIHALRLGAVGWGRYAWNQLDDTAIGATNLIANYNFQRGRAIGAEGTAELSLHYLLSAFANVSWEIAQGQGIASAKYLFTPDQIADPSWQTLDHAQTLTANLGVTLHEGHASFTALAAYGSGLRTGPSNNQTVPEHVRVDATLQYAFHQIPLHPTVALDVINLFDAHYAYRIANGFVGSSWAAPRSIFLRVAVPLTGGVR